MKKLVMLFAILALVSCKKETSQENFGKPDQANEGMKAEVQTPKELGESLFTGKGNCVACHQKEQKVIGPSLQEIAKIYKEKGGDIVKFLKEDATPIVDPSQYEVMKTNFAITKAMSDEELKGIEAYIFSNSK